MFRISGARYVAHDIYIEPGERTAPLTYLAILQHSRRLQIIARTCADSNVLDALQSHSHRARRTRCILYAI